MNMFHYYTPILVYVSYAWHVSCVSLVVDSLLRFCVAGLANWNKAWERLLLQINLVFTSSPNQLWKMCVFLLLYVKDFCLTIMCFIRNSAANSSTSRIFGSKVGVLAKQLTFSASLFLDDDFYGVTTDCLARVPNLFYWSWSFVISPCRKAARHCWVMYVADVFVGLSCVGDRAAGATPGLALTHGARRDAPQSERGSVCVSYSLSSPSTTQMSFSVSREMCFCALSYGL